jgi:hypothetical protein
MCDPSIVKVGCALDNDLTEFEGILGKAVPSTIDIQTLAKSLGWPEISLEKLANRCLNKGKFKVNIISNWSSPILSRELIQYAAADALLTLKVYQSLLGVLPRNSALDKKPVEVVSRSPTKNLAERVSTDNSSPVCQARVRPTPSPICKTAELDQIVLYLQSHTLFRGGKDPHISKVISVLSSTYSEWVRTYGKPERKRKANWAIKQLIDAKILHPDAVLHTVSFNRVIAPIEAHAHASKEVNESYDSIKEIAIHYLKSIFSSATYPIKMANVLENRFFSSRRFSKYIARALLARLVERGEVLETPSGMVVLP